MSGELLIGDVAKGQSPLVITVPPSADSLGRYTITCAACGPNVQHTGEGGYLTPEEAGIEAQSHRLTHLSGLVDEIREADAHVRLGD